MKNIHLYDGIIKFVPSALMTKYGYHVSVTDSEIHHCSNCRRKLTTIQGDEIWSCTVGKVVCPSCTE